MGTNANSLQALIAELGKKKFGHTPTVGDCFAGGGSIPFEAARMGCEVYASDLNPIACLLTWADLNILSKSDNEVERLKEFQKKVYNKVDKQIEELGIENNENGDRGISYLYCIEAKCPECEYIVPMFPSFIVGKGSKTVLTLEKNIHTKSFNIDILENVDDLKFNQAIKNSTISDNKLICPNCKSETPISSIRKDINDGIKRPYRYNTPNSLRKWKQSDYKNDKNDIFRERLYCIRYEHEAKKYYSSVTKQDLDREEMIESIVKNNIIEWQNNGYIPSSKIEPGWNTNQPIYEKGWTHWNHLFNPRQLLINALFNKSIHEIANSKEEYCIGILGLNKCADWNCKLSRWINGSGVENTTQLFYNQAINTLYNYGARGLSSLKSTWFYNINNNKFTNKVGYIKPIDARDINIMHDIWITDPPYADAVNYHELSEFFLAWDKKVFEDVFTDWYPDSKRVLAVQGKGQSFNQSMIEVYSNLAKNTEDNGMQVVMFTHQDVKVWAELALILWASGLQVTAAWNIATETESGGLKEGGNYVKGTVILVLRKQNSDYTAYLDELYPEIEDEVKLQIDTMKELDDKEDPNFTDADYLLAAYAASLKVLTSYKNIEDIDVQYELSKSDGESPIVNIINDAVKIAFDYLTPNGFDSYTWKTLLPEERFYIKGLDTEKNNVYKVSAYQELGRGFGVNEYSDMMASTKANKSRLKTASEFAMNYTNDNTKFGHSILRNVLVALYKSTKEEDATKGKAWLRNEVDDYWNERSKIIEILDYIATLEYIENMKHWEKDAKSAKILVELVRNDGV